MDPILNPYSPGAGHQPPELAGRDTLRQRINIAIARIKAGRAAKSILMIGLRGVGKTVLLEQMRKDAEAQGAQTLRIEAPERRSLPSLLAPQLRVSLLKLSRVEAAKDLATRGLKALAGFVKGLKVTFNDIEVGLDVESEPGLADNGDLEGDLTTLLEQVGLAAQSANTALVMFIDEMQYLEENQLAALITALHRCSQLNLPVTLVGAGLPQLRGRTGNAKSYAERLFDFSVVGPLNRDESTQAIVIPAQAQDVHFEQAAIEAIIIKTQGYPYFIQEWGSHTWLEAQSSPITAADVDNASIIAIAALDESFFGVRFDRLTPLEKRYLRAMAELGPGPHRSGDIAEQLGKKSSALGLVRTSLINKGMIWSPNHGDNAFTVPLFDSFMRRAMPGDDWNSH